MKILIVEDEPKTGDYHQTARAGRVGFMVDLARSGVDGLHLAMTGDYDLLVLDVMLPGMNGWQLLDILRQGQRHSGDVSDGAGPGGGQGSRPELGPTITSSSPFVFSEFLARCAPSCARARAAWSHAAAGR